MRKSWIFVLLLVMCSSRAVPSEAFEKIWIHAHEEDRDGLQVYRPSTYRFPPARGRDGFRMLKNGQFIMNDIGPADGKSSLTGRWSTSNDLIHVSFPENPERRLSIQVISADSSRLVARITE